MTSTPTDNEVLAQFREEWKKEVKQRTAAHHTSSTVEQPVTSPSTFPTRAPRRERGLSVEETIADLEPQAGQVSQSTNTAGPSASRPPRRLSWQTAIKDYSPSMISALEIYRNAVAAEERGDLDAAVHLYRASFRIDSQVDRAYRRAFVTGTMASQSGKGKMIASSTENEEVSSRTEVLGELPSNVNPEVDAISASLSKISIQHSVAPLAEVISHFHDIALTFEPEDERAPVLLAILPDELIASILVQLAKIKDVASIEHFGLVSRKARMISLDVGIWKLLVQTVYVPPQVEENVRPLLLYKHYGSDFRQMYINHPRVRLDGVYIAVCHYVRSGYSENAWVAISHLITYHRYLRFLPDGKVLSFLTNEEQPPSQVVHQLKPSLKTKGHYVGTWRLDGTTVTIEDLFDSEGRALKYGFEMTLELRSKPVGRWNRMDLIEYRSVNLETGEAEPLALKHERPFWFSKVKSYSS